MIERRIFPIMLTKNVVEWQQLLDAADVPHAPVKVVGSPLRFENRCEQARLEPPPLLGEPTRAVLGALAGLSDAEIERLIVEKVIAVPGAKKSDH